MGQKENLHPTALEADKLIDEAVALMNDAKLVSASSALNSALELLIPLLNAYPENRTYKKLTADAYYFAASISYSMNKPNSLERIGETIEYYEHLDNGLQQEPFLRKNLMKLFAWSGSLLSKTSQISEADKHTSKARTLGQSLESDGITDSEIRRTIFGACINLASSQTSEVSWREVVDRYEDLRRRGEATKEDTKSYQLALHRIALMDKEKP